MNEGEWQCFLVGEITIGLALHWPCISDSVGSVATVGISSVEYGIVFIFTS